MNTIKTLNIFFSNPIPNKELLFFRGAVIASLEKDSILFHNHLDDGFRYSYPLIQYKRIQGKAAIVCIGEGTEDIGEFFSSSNFEFDINGNKKVFVIEKVKAQEATINIDDDFIYYRLHSWLPLNQENFALYNDLEGIVEKTQMLEKILIGNILSMLKGIQFFTDKQLVVNITNILKEKSLRYKKIKFTSFDLEFKSNIQLPNYIGIGKSASIGFGILTRSKKQK